MGGAAVLSCDIAWCRRALGGDLWTLPGRFTFLLEPDDRARFEQVVLPHLDAAFNLARWLLRNRSDAEDVAQEALLRAYRFFGGFHGGVGNEARGWLLQIVRNTCYTWLEKNRPMEFMPEFDETHHSPISGAQTGSSPEALAIANADGERLTRALEKLPPRFREVLVLRELEGCSYKEIAAITAVPMGTVMSALSRARRQLQLALGAPDLAAGDATKAARAPQGGTP